MGIRENYSVKSCYFIIIIIIILISIQDYFIYDNNMFNKYHLKDLDKYNICMRNTGTRALRIFVIDFVVGKKI